MPWKPPSYAQPVEVDNSGGWTPPDYASLEEEDPLASAKSYLEQNQPLDVQPEVDNESRLARAWRYANTPITDLPSRLAAKVAEPMMAYGEQSSDIPHQISRIGGAYLQSLGNVTSESTSPLQIGLLGSAIGGRAIGAAAEGLPELTRLAKAVELPSRIAGVGAVGHGSYRFAGGATPDERASGLAEAILGGLAAHSQVPRMPNMGEVMPETGMSRFTPEQVSGQQPFVEGELVNEPPPVTDTSGRRLFAPEYEPREQPRPPGPWDTNASNTEWKPPDYAEPVAPEPSATFSHFDAEGQPKFHVSTTQSDVGLEKLQELGIKPPEVPEQISKIPAPIKSVLDEAGIDSSKMGVDEAVNKARELRGLSSIEEPSASAVRDDSRYDEFGRADKTSQNPRYVEAEADAKRLGINPGDFDNLFDLEWAITQKTAQETVRTGKNPLMTGKLDEPSSAKVEGENKIKIGADIESLGKVLGSSLYKGDITKIATKELLQNSVDAIRHLDANGNIDIHLNDKDGYVEVKDNGKGLTRQELETVFTDLGSSGKRSDTEAVGGFGLAKAAPLLGGEKVEVTSVAKEPDGTYIHSFKGSPNELIKGVDITSYKVADDTPTGTVVKTYVPKKEGLSWKMADAQDYVRTLVSNSPAIRGKVNLTRTREDNSPYYGEGKAETHTNKIDLKKADIKTLSNPSADVDIIIPSGTKYGPSGGVRYSILNNGMYQSRAQAGWQEIPGIPENLLINIKSKVPEGHPDYPFTANREELRGSTQTQVEQYIKENIVNPAVGTRMKQLQEVYKGMPLFKLPSKNPRKFFIYDVGKKLAPNELREFTSNKELINLSVHISDMIHDVMTATQEAKLNDKLEKIGLILDEKVHGIHIPNPGEEKSAILINPFSTMGMYSPDQMSTNISHTILHEIAHVEGGGHDEQFTVRLGKIYQKLGRKMIRQYEDKIYDSITDPSTGEYNQSISRLLQKYTESRGRPSPVEDPLYGTGIKSANKGPEGEGEIPEPNSSGKERTPEESISRLIDALKSGAINRQKQNKLYSMERAKRVAAMENVKEPGIGGYFKQRGMLKGELPKIPTESQLDETDVNNLIDMISKVTSLRPFQKFNAKTALVELLAGKTPTPSDIKMLSGILGDEFGKAIQLFGGLGVIPTSIGSIVRNTVNLPKTLMSTGDLSAPLRQGLPLIYRTEYWNAFRDMFSFFGDNKVFKALQDSLITRKNFQLGDDAGLYLAGIGDKLENREEAFLSTYAGKIPLYGKFTNASERAYIGFLNKLRADTFDSLIKDAQAAGHPLYTTKKNKNGEVTRVINPIVHEIANFVNNSSGRGSLGRFEKNAVDLNALFFSPRLIASRLTLLNPKYYSDSNPFIRQQHLKSLFAIAGFSILTAILTAMAKGKTGTDPTNSDFAKSIFKDTRLDPNAGFQQYLVAATRLITGSESTTSGRRYDLSKGKFPGPTRLGVISNLVRSKESPIASFVDTMLSGEQAYPPSGLGGLAMSKLGANKPTAEVINRVVPMLSNDLVDLYRSDPDWIPGLTLPVLGTFGASLQTNQPPKPKSPFRIRTSNSIHGIGGETITPP